ncbi:hypothetical protein [Streptomyces sp. MMBL 11-1]|uniref:hypothetical protein n=1 Tax=Streptomyces sp. MMBL 11-1 TaxID=3026420 RepID=UPI0023608B27|nr:hypothetical protein [Streptomyces sp. MMBL 11-1]
MSRTQWWSLAALLTVVVGLLCGPVATAVPPTVASGGTAPMVAAPFAAAPTASAAPAQALDPTSAQVPDATSAQVPDATSAQTQAPALAPMAEDADAGTRVPGCGKLRDHDGEPAVPSRARSGYDQPPGLAPWGLPAATVVLPAEPPPGARARAPATHTPTPVELSVLRV